MSLLFYMAAVAVGFLIPLTFFLEPGALAEAMLLASTPKTEFAKCVLRKAGVVGLPAQLMPSPCGTMLTAGHWH